MLRKVFSSSTDQNNSPPVTKCAFSTLPSDIHKQIFSFFNRNDLHRIGCVSKRMNAITKEMLDKAPTYYTIGKNFDLCIQSGSMLRMRKPNEIKKEIQESIFKSYNLFLFKTEHDALEFARAMRTEPDIWMALDIAHGAIFKVKYLGERPAANWRARTFTISRHTAQERQVTLNCLRVKNESVHIISGQLKYDSGLNGLQESAIVDFSTDPDLNPRQRSTCIIS